MQTDNDFIAMIGIVANAVTDNKVEIGNCDINKVLKYAKEQSVFHIICSVIKSLDNRYKNIALGSISKNVSDLTYIRKILDELEKNNIEFVILKGESIAVGYRKPELRISGDVDLLVEEKDEKKTLEIFKEYGYSYTKRPEWGNETALHHPNRKEVEVHISLHDKSREDIFFGEAANLCDPFMRITTENLGEINVLSPNDGIMFLYLHFVKHFLSSGAGIRQLLDVSVYSRYYKDKIDWDKFFNKLESIHYLQLYRYILSVAVKYMGFKKEDLPIVNYDFEKADIIVEDLRHCGIFGHNEADLTQFKRIYEKKRNEKYGFVNYDEYEKIYHTSKLKIIFPSLIIMKEKYDYLKKHPYLLPIAWIQRIVSAGWGMITKKKKIKTYTNINTINTNQAINDRMKLMEELDII